MCRRSRPGRRRARLPRVHRRVRHPRPAFARRRPGLVPRRRRRARRGRATRPRWSSPRARASTRWHGRSPRSTRDPVLVLEWTDPPFCAGHWVPDLVAAGGGIAVLAVPGGDSHRITWDAVRSAPADVVLVAPCGYHLDRPPARRAARRRRPASRRCRGVGGRRRQPLRPARTPPRRGRRDGRADPAPRGRRRTGTRPGAARRRGVSSRVTQVTRRGRGGAYVPVRPDVNAVAPDTLVGVSASTHVNFWGVRGSTPCDGHQFDRYGGNTSCVEVASEGHDPIVFDLGTGLRNYGDALAAEGRSDGYRARCCSPISTGTTSRACRSSTRWRRAAARSPSSVRTRRTAPCTRCSAR